MNFSSGLVIVKKTLHILSFSNMENALSIEILFFLKFPQSNFYIDFLTLL